MTDISSSNITIKTLHVLHIKCCSGVKSKLKTCNILHQYTEASGGKTRWRYYFSEVKGVFYSQKHQGGAGVYSLNNLRSQCHFLSLSYTRKRKSENLCFLLCTAPFFLWNVWDCIPSLTFQIIHAAMVPIGSWVSCWSFVLAEKTRVPFTVLGGHYTTWRLKNIP